MKKETPVKGKQKYLLDTNIVIRALAGHEPEISFFKNHLSKGALAISVIVIAEFYSKANATEKKIFGRLLNGVEVIGINSQMAKTAGEYRQEFSRKSKRIFLLDCFFAAQAKKYNLTLVTNNKTDFPMKDIKTISP